MHVPGHYLDPASCAVTAAAAAGALAYGAGRVRREGLPSASLTATTAAGIFAVQMVNFPVTSGTSGHLVGGVLAGMILGPWVGMWSLALVLAVQATLFGDGALATLGANVLNMGVIGALVGMGLRRFLVRPDCSVPVKLGVAAAAGWGAVVAGAALCSIELAASGTFALSAALPAMVSIHALIGISEALLTAAAAALVLRSAPQLLSSPTQLSPQATASTSPAAFRWLPAVGLVAAMAIAALLAPIASTLPDGLESVAKALNLAEPAAAWTAPMQNYSLSGIGSPLLATAAAGILGVLILFGVTCGWEALLKTRLIGRSKVAVANSR
jgi:cobalt/nickel transport system permease protein